MNITADDLETWDYSDLDHVHYLIGCEKDRRRIQSYPDEFTKILREGLDGYDEGPLYALIEEYSKITGEYNRYCHISTVSERLGRDGKQIDCTSLTVKCD